MLTSKVCSRTPYSNNARVLTALKETHPLDPGLISFQVGDLLTVLTLSGEYPDVVATAASKEVIN